MGRYSNYKENRPKDFWPTVDPDAITPVFEMFVRGKTYAEPCWGDGSLEGLLTGAGAVCRWASDIRPNDWYTCDALDVTKQDVSGCDLIITNPPFSWEMLKTLLDHLPTLKPTWLLLPASQMHNKRMGPYMRNCKEIVSVGRLYWVNGPDDPSPHKGIKGKEDYCWYLFYPSEQSTRFWGR